MHILKLFIPRVSVSPAWREEMGKRQCSCDADSEACVSDLDSDILGREPCLALLYSWPLLPGAKQVTSNS